MLQTILVLADPVSNHNKFYRVTMGDDASVSITWGRVGAAGQSQEKGSGEHIYRQLIEAKRKKGYTDVAVIGSDAGTAVTSRDALRSASRKALAGADPALTALVDRLVAINAHDIKLASGGQIKVVDGGVSTPLGMLSVSAVVEARALLTMMRQTRVTDAMLSSYLRLVPQKVPSQRGWGNDFFTAHTTFAAQETFLDALEQSVRFAGQPADGDEATAMFRYRLTKVTGKAVIKSITARFTESANTNHASASSKLVAVYELVDTIRADEVAEAAKVGNVRRMWHGSRAANVLSILSTGLVVPPSSSRHVTGRMFGDGVYLSEQSTKSLNYSRGGVWSTGHDSQHFMFMADVAMGHEMHPNRHGTDYAGARAGRVKGSSGTTFDSINVKPGTSGVRNHEAIVWNPDQVNMRYLVEFSG